MIESIENALQIAVLLACISISLYRAVTQRSRAWTMLSFFYGSQVLGDIYWLVCLIFYHDTPRITVISDLNWYASYILLYMLLRHTAPPVSAREKRALPWLGYAFAMLMAAFFFSFYIYWNTEQGMRFLLWAKAIDNLICGMLIGLLLFSGIRRLMDRKTYSSQRSLCILILVFCFIEYGLWTSSCFWWEETMANPYYWFDFLLTASFPFFIPATGKAVAA